MPQLGRLSSRSLSGLVPNPPSSPLFNTLTWTTYTVPTANATIGQGSIVSSGGSVFFNVTPSGQSNLSTVANKVYTLSSGVVSLKSLPTPSNYSNCYPHRIVNSGTRIVALALGWDNSYYGVWYSDDGGATFNIQNYTPASFIPTGHSLTSFSYANGNYFIFTRSGTSNNWITSYTTSSDGITWGSLAPIAQNSLTETLGFNSTAYDPSSQTLIGTSGSTSTRYYKSNTSGSINPTGVVGTVGSVPLARSCFWAPELGVFGAANFGSGAYYITPANVAISAPAWTTWPAPGSSLDQGCIASVSGKTSVIYFTPITKTNPARISFDGGLTFANSSLPDAGTYYYVPFSTNGKFYLVQNLATASFNIYEGVLS